MSRHKNNVGAYPHSRGVTFRVWAPFADSVALTGTFNNNEETPMESEGDGYWSLQVRDAKPGQEYKYVIVNGDKKLFKNDPRALQLTATGGTSLIVDQHFDWNDDDFTLPPRDELIIYELHVGSFHRADASTEGTFYNLIEKLDHLHDLGVNMIELMPISSMLNDHGWGYAPDYIYAVESAYGGRHALLEFVNAAHQRGIGVMLDVVYNHFGPDANLDMWRFDGWSENDLGGIYFYNDWRAETPWAHTRPDMGRFEVRQFLLDNVRYWLHECHLDGLRVDSTLYTRNVYGRHDDPSTDLPEAWSLFQDLNTRAHSIKQNSLTVGEDIGENDYITKPSADSGAGFDSQWLVTLPHTFRNALATNSDTDIDLSGLLGELARLFNDDALQRVIYIDSHDSAANGAARLNQEIDPDHPTSPQALAKSLIAAGILFTIPGIPMMLQGQEFAQAGSFDDWHELNWKQADQLSGITTAYKHLVALRQNAYSHTAGLKSDNINISHVDKDNNVIVYHRWDKGGEGDDVMVIANFGSIHHTQYVLGFPLNGTFYIRFNSTWSGYHQEFKNIDVKDVIIESGSGTVELPPHSILILSQG